MKNIIKLENMKCPNCENQNLEKIAFYGNEVDYCPNCLGLWFDKEELRTSKDKKDKDLSWVDIDLWRDKEKFSVGKGRKTCPICEGAPLYEVNYGNSKVKVDVCGLCEGIWLDRGEFKQIIYYLKRKEKYEVVNNYLGNLAEEAAEIFIGPESFKSELKDFLILMGIMKHKFFSKHPKIMEFVNNIQRSAN